MDGDLAPLDAISPLYGANGAWLLVDDARGLGVVGAGSAKRRGASGYCWAGLALKAILR